MAKDPVKSAAGKLGARARWGDERRIVRIADLSPAQRRLVLALVDAARAETQKVGPVTSARPERREPDAA